MLLRADVDASGAVMHVGDEICRHSRFVEQPTSQTDYEQRRYAMPLDRWELLRQKLQETAERKTRAAWEARQRQIRREKRWRPTKLTQIVDDFCARHG